MRNCSKCGSIVQDGMKFCRFCGTPVEETNQSMGNNNQSAGYQNSNYGSNYNSYNNAGTYGYNPQYNYPRSSNAKFFFLSRSENIVSTVCKISALSFFVLSIFLGLIQAIDYESFYYFSNALTTGFINSLILYSIAEIIDYLKLTCEKTGEIKTITADMKIELQKKSEASEAKTE